MCSYGVGVAYLERNLLLAAPELELTCTDFAPRAVERLRGLFQEATFVLHDLRTDPPLDSDLHLFHRLDTEFSDDEWPEVFARFRAPVLVVATELLGLRNIARELLAFVRHPRASKAGWIRSEDALRALWSASHEDRRVELYDLPGYVLTPR